MPSSLKVAVISSLSPMVGRLVGRFQRRISGQHAVERFLDIVVGDFFDRLVEFQAFPIRRLKFGPDFDLELVLEVARIGDLDRVVIKIGLADRRKSL